ncbi:X-linked interleukin-1 receptor accessory protein-like 2 [Platysternon megacephalum]|uniref:X-linked interleukin-1 receptor accessory protein-like 2 n=1 Tax=Platysternon megacephalum TaxID=55544 RepID=A0A4D9FCS8_9SAUR|nr:X-linked interleukin-1 receptor accessory protein-like 2 [Platysternon megacephalum]
MLVFKGEIPSAVKLSLSILNSSHLRAQSCEAFSTHHLWEIIWIHLTVTQPELRLLSVCWVRFWKMLSLKAEGVQHNPGWDTFCAPKNAIDLSERFRCTEI